MKRIANFLFSTRLMAILFIVFALAMAIATFLENSYSTEFAKIYIYNTTWFELIILLFAVNFIGNIKEYQLLRRRKWATLMLHLSFLFIILGAGVTRYISFEGMMPIKEGQTANTFYSANTYLTVYMDGEVDGQMMRKKENFYVLMAEHANNHHTFQTDFKGQRVELEITNFIYGAKRTIVPDKTGDRYLKIVEAGSGHREDHYIKEGSVMNLHNIIFAFNNPTPGAVNIHIDEQGNATLNSPFPGNFMRMATQATGKVYADSTQQLAMRSLYNVNGLRFVFPEPVIRGHYDLVHDESQEENGKDGVFVTLRTKGQEKQIKLLGSQGRIGKFTDVEMGGLDIHVRYGSKAYQLPFSLHLDDFIAAKYPGTANNPTPSYSSFKSKVTLVDEGKAEKHEIYMNHVLDYGGYRFFQSSFMPDESGTILSVNHDWWGTNITYLGYTLLYISMILIFFIKGSRFRNLGDKLKRVKKRKDKSRNKLMGVLTILVMLGSFTGYAQTSREDLPNYDESQQTQHNHDTLSRTEKVNQARKNIALWQSLSKEALDSIIVSKAVPKEHALAFGGLVMQDYQGRMKPVNTYSSELLRKLSRSETYAGLNSDQILISMTQNPIFWYNVPILKIDRNDEKLHDVLGIPADQNMLKLTQFFDETGVYKLAPYLEEAYRAKVKSQFQKDLTETDGKVNLLYSALRGRLLRIFPIPGDRHNTWVSYPQAVDSIHLFSNSKDSLFVTNALPLYMQSLYTENYTQANTILESIKTFQRKYAADIIPDESKVEAEILYNKYDIFQNLFWQYLLAGLFTFIFVIFEIFYPKKWIRSLISVGKIALILLFVLHTVALIARWYISGHAPWSNAYESMIYVAWATMLFGIVFGRKSSLTLASTAFVTSMIMMIAHWNWLDPAIGHMPPVLDSYWIMIHTSVIVGSYGPFTIGAILGVVTLLLMIFTNKNNVKKMKLNVKELTIITEMALIIGLVMLTIGNFLGGQWANESWGRYWSWDPKETWALISIMVYAFVIHMRLVPGLRNRFAFNWVTIIAFGSILFTYFGVNFYLSGLHSYASGDQIISYKFIAIALAVWGILGALSYWKYKKYYKKVRRKK